LGAPVVFPPEGRDPLLRFGGIGIVLEMNGEIPLKNTGHSRLTWSRNAWRTTKIARREASKRNATNVGYGWRSLQDSEPFKGRI
jgi:hypothetical protein